MSSFKDIYQRFINLAIASEKLSDFPVIDSVEQKLLNLLIPHWSNNEPITVVEAMNISKEISTSTTFRYLKKLRQKGYIELVVDEADNRVKYVSPTKQTDQYFSALGKLMSNATI